jgi:proline-specific peptidase
MNDDRGGEKSWKGWKCDDLTPDLCSLHEKKGTMLVKGGINLTYWKYESLDTLSHEGDKLPIVAIHGGPGVAHNYLLPLKQQACRGRPVIFYDQAGCGESKLPENASLIDYPWLLDPKYYSLEELPKLVDYLGLSNYHVVGNSWGSLLCQMFGLDAADERLASMVLSGTFSDAQHYIQGQWDPKDGNLGSLPPYVQKRLHELEDASEYESEEYEAIVRVLADFFTCRTAPAPDCVNHAVAGTNEEIYVGMQGPSEFSIAGSLAHYNVTARLAELNDLPVLLTSGKFDTMRPKVVEEVYRALPTAEWVILERSGHMSMVDEPGSMNDAIADFLDRVEASRASSKPFLAPLKSHDISVSEPAPPFHGIEILGAMLLSAAVGWILGYNSSNRQRRVKYSNL